MLQLLLLPLLVVCLGVPRWWETMPLAAARVLSDIRLKVLVLFMIFFALTLALSSNTYPSEPAVKDLGTLDAAEKTESTMVRACVQRAPCDTKTGSRRVAASRSCVCSP